MKLHDLFEQKEVTIIGKIVNKNLGSSKGIIFTDEMSNRRWGELEFNCENLGLTSLVGCPEFVAGSFNATNNNLTSLEGAPAHSFGYFDCTKNKITSLKNIHKQIKQLSGIFYGLKNPIKSHVLGILLVDGCTSFRIDNTEVSHIISKYLPNDRGRAAMYDCQAELIEAGFEEFAQL